MKKSVLIISIIVVTLILLVFLGPRVTSVYTLKDNELTKDLDKYLSATEKINKPVNPGTEKTIIWAGEKGVKTPLSLIYLHGFTGSRKELTPVCEKTAELLGANIFFTRFKGHGQGPEALASVTLSDWMNDTVEAWEIGKRIGGKVIVIATSTGAAFAEWIAVRDPAELAGLVLVSPNHRPADPNAQMILLPWGNLIVSLVAGKYMENKPINSDQEKYITMKYRSEAVLPMMAAVQLANELPLENIKVPTLCLYNEKDTVVSVKAILNAFARIGSARKQIVNIKDAPGHVLAGDITSPGTTEKAITLITGFFKDLMPAQPNADSDIKESLPLP